MKAGKFSDPNAIDYAIGGSGKRGQLVGPGNWHPSISKATPDRLHESDSSVMEVQRIASLSDHLNLASSAGAAESVLARKV